jgi:hypothetical protein
MEALKKVLEEMEELKKAVQILEDTNKNLITIKDDERQNNKDIVERIVDKKFQLENDICNVVSELFEKFKEETGCSPSSIYIRLGEIQTLGKSVNETYIESCEVDITL